MKRVSVFPLVTCSDLLKSYFCFYLYYFQEQKKPLRELSRQPNMNWGLKQCAITTKTKAFVLMQAAIFAVRIEQVIVVYLHLLTHLNPLLMHAQFLLLLLLLLLLLFFSGSLRRKR